MTTAFQRLNERKQRPNSRIDFIKAIDNHPHGEDFLNRIAAQCFPVMNKAGINVRSLEEYEHNPEFLGRNFNGGEVIQLVLKDRQGRWLSLNFVQMVMMHELAHCKQMNHSRAFWAVRNDYAKQMEDIWKSGYVGEGIHGRGRDLENGSIVHNRPPDMSQVPGQLCGGTFRKRGRKRKAGSQGDQPAKVSYAERQQRRMEKKFGKHGEGATVGEDYLLRGALETMNGGKRRQGKPKVAKSKRGRDLCANAALARFEHAKSQPKKEENTPEPEDSETESEWEDEFVKVCGDEGDGKDGNEAGHEMDALRMLSAGTTQNKGSKIHIKEEPVGEISETESEADDDPDSKAGHAHVTRGQPALTPDETNKLREIDRAQTVPEAEEQATTDLTSSSASTSATNCPVCSLENEAGSTLCIACSHVLRPELVREHWRCQSETCKGSKYINAGDFGRCGLCNASKPQVSKPSLGQGGRAVGLTRPEVLRWD